MLLRLGPQRYAAPLSWLSRPPTQMMPLRAKIQNAAFSSASRTMAEEPPMPREEPGDDPNDVLFHSTYGVRTIELNRPQKLNSLNGSMARKIIPRLKEWGKSQMISAVIIAGAGEKAFCAGGDVAALALNNKKGSEGQAESAKYFGLEYTLDHLIATYNQPYIAYMDGITMGGGVGLSVHAPLRIATERTVFAMPETTIGFFPDVGASFFLPRLDGRLGKYLALTSERLDGANSYYTGVATHFVHSTALGDLTARLAELQFPDHESTEHRLRHLDAAIAEFDSGLPEDQPLKLRGAVRAAIDRCFGPASLDGIMAELRNEQADGTDATRAWAARTLDTLAQRSPTSLRVTVKLLALAEKHRWNIAQTFQREYGLARRFMAHHDFTEGVLARLVEKRKPGWEPTNWEDVTATDVDEFFQDEGRDLQLLTPGDYTEYPHRACWWLGLPSEAEVVGVLRRGDMETAEQVVQYFMGTRPGKSGVREKVEEIVDRVASQKGG